MTIASELAGARAPLEHRLRVLVAGDSLALGAVEVRGRGDVVGRVTPSCIDHLQATFPQVDWRIDAVAQRTSADLRAQITGMLDQHHPDMVILMVVGSDADINWRRFIASNGAVARSHMPVNECCENLDAITRAVRAAGARCILTDVPNHALSVRGPYLTRLCGRDVSEMLARGGGQQVSDRGLQDYRQAIAALAERLQTPLARFGEALAGYPVEAVVGADGMHPNEFGHRIIAQVIARVIADELQARKATAAAS